MSEFKPTITISLEDYNNLKLDRDRLIDEYLFDKQYFYFKGLSNTLIGVTKEFLNDTNVTNRIDSLLKHNGICIDINTREYNLIGKIYEAPTAFAGVKVNGEKYKIDK